MINRRQLFSIPLVLLIANMAYAENNKFLREFVGMSNGRLCGTVEAKELAKLKDACKHSRAGWFNHLKSNNEDIFEWSIFQSAARLQLQKNECLQQRLDKFQKNPELLQQWVKFLAVSWLSQKKAKLILEKCGVIKVNSSLSKVAGINSVKFDDSLNPKWREVCGDEKSLASLKAANALAEFAMPVVSNSEFFDVFEKNRKIWLNKKTGQPVSDEELLNADLTNIDFLTIKEKTLVGSVVSYTTSDGVKMQHVVSRNFNRLVFSGPIPITDELTGGINSLGAKLKLFEGRKAANRTKRKVDISE